jgi:hypothetical protein
MMFLAEKLNSKIPVLSLIISITVAWMIPPVSGFPLIPLFIFFVGLSSLVYFLRKEKGWFDTVLYVGVVVLSCFTIYRANSFLQFFDVLFIVFFGSLLMRPLLEEHGVFSLMLSPLIVIINTFTAKNIFPFTFELPAKNLGKSYFRELIPTILVTLLVLLVTIPLLASANPFFNSLLQHFLQFFNLTWLFKYIFVDPFEVYIARGIVFAVLSYSIPRALSLSVEGMKNSNTRRLVTINYLYPKFALSGLLLVFFFTQIQLYFASSVTLQSIGYTNSRLTNEVFFQVTLVAFIVLFLAYMDKTRKKWNSILTYFLSVQALFLIGIAFKSVFDYSSINGFTLRRLWGYTSMIWLSGVLVVFTLYYKNQTSHLHFIKQILTYTLVLLSLVNMLNFDYLIYHIAKPTVAGATDYGYISNLSPDAQYEKEALGIVVAEAEKSKFSDASKTNSVYAMLSNIDYLRLKYKSKHDISSFNFGEYQEYLTIKDINTQAYRRKITDTHEKQKTNKQSTQLPFSEIN